MYGKRRNGDETLMFVIAEMAADLDLPIADIPVAADVVERTIRTVAPGSSRIVVDRSDHAHRKGDASVP